VLKESFHRPVLAQPGGERCGVELSLFACAPRRRVDDGPIAGTAIDRKRAAKADTEYSRVIGRHFCFRPYFGWRNSIPLAVSDRWHSCGDGGDDGLVIDALAERGEPPNQLLPKSCAIGRARLDWDSAKASDILLACGVTVAVDFDQRQLQPGLGVAEANEHRPDRGGYHCSQLTPTMTIANQLKWQEARTRAKFIMIFFVQS
jgi:hypothetical protein